MVDKNIYPKVSVIVPVYNVDNYLRECLDSIFNQSFNDIEVICINDGSEDKSYDILNEYKTMYNNLIVFNQENKGVSSARNVGISAAKGKYILFVDSDDYLRENACEVAYSEAEKDQVDILSFGVYKITYPYHRWHYKPFSMKEHIYTKDPFLALFTGSDTVLVWNKIYKRDLLLKNNIFFENDITFLEDECFNFTVFPKSKKIKYIPNALYQYRQKRSGSAVYSYSKDKKISSQKILIERICKIWRENKYLDEHASQLLNFFLDFNYAAMYSALKDESKVKDVINEILFSIGEDIFNVDNIKKLSTVCQNRVKDLLK